MNLQENRLYYDDLKINQEVKVQIYSGELTNSFFTGEITNCDGQNIVVKVGSRNGDKLEKERDYEACNPDWAIVTSTEEVYESEIDNICQECWDPDCSGCNS